MAYFAVGENAHCDYGNSAADTTHLFTYHKRMSAKIFPHRGWIAAAFLLLALAAGLWWARPREENVAAVNIQIATDHPIRVEHGQAGGVVDSLVGVEGVPNVELPINFYDFGAVTSHAVVKHDFLVINRGKGPLIIHQAYTTCGCTTADLSASRVPPDQAARVTIIFDAGFHNVSGQTVRRGLILETNDPDHPEVEIWVQAEVKP